MTIARLGELHVLSAAATAMSQQIEQREELRRMRNDPAWMAASSLWRRCAAVGLLLIDGEPICSDAAMSLRTTRTAALRSLLAGVAGGRTPCLTDAGELIFPTWAERRVDARRPLGLAAKLNGLREAKPVVIRDMSETGMGLDEVGEFEPGGYVSITLPTGRVISGTVVWQRDGRAGIRLSDPLSANDPLLTNSLTW